MAGLMLWAAVPPCSRSTGAPTRSSPPS
jgi:hypothetical protein